MPQAFKVAVILGASLICASSALAQSKNRLEARLDQAVSKVQNACSDDLKQYCSNVTPGEGRMLLCLGAHEDKISSKCDVALFDASRNLERALDRIEMAADACWNDVQKHCADVPAGGGGILQCLTQNKSSLSKGCQRVVGKLGSSQ